MSDVVVVESVRSPVGKRNGGLSGMHSADLLANVLGALVDRSGIDPNEVEQVVGGCVGQVGMQTGNIARTGWLPFSVRRTRRLFAACAPQFVTFCCRAMHNSRQLADQRIKTHKRLM